MSRMRHIIGILIALVILGAHAVETAYAQGQPPAGALVVLRGQSINGDLATTSQPIIVEGEVIGDVTTWNGNITIDGHVHGDVISYSGTVLLETNAQVDGNILTAAGTVKRNSAKQQITGQVIEGAPGGSVIFGLIDLFSPSAPGTVPASGPALRAVFSSAAMLVALALCTLATLLWPRRTLVTRSTLRAAPWRSLALGTLTTALLSLLLIPIGALLAVTLVGVLLILPLFLLLHVPYVYGLAVVGQLLGRRLFPNQREFATPGGVLLILLPLVLLSIAAPLASVIFIYLVAGTGLGAVLLSRGGTLAVR